MTLRVQIRGNDYVLLGGNGDELLTSKEYADNSGAKRSARNLFDQLQGADVVLEVGFNEGTERKPKWVRDEVLAESKVAVVGSTVEDGPVGGTITVPPDGKSAHALSPHATSNPGATE